MMNQGVLSADPEYYQYWAQVDLDAEEREDEMMEYTVSHTSLTLWTRMPEQRSILYQISWSTMLIIQ